MKNLNFKTLKASNFLCFGENGLHVDFMNQQSTTLIRGRNLDACGEKSSGQSSNGVGKSAVIDALVWGLFGKTVKRPSKIGADDVLNNADPKKLSVFVEFDNYRVTRTRKPNALKLEVFRNDAWEEQTRGTIKDTQTDIENILGLSYEAFVSIVIFSDDNSASFLECPTTTKRKIVETLLGLEKFQSFLDTAKEHAKNLKKQIADHTLITQQKTRMATQYGLELDKLKTQSAKYIEDIKRSIETQNAIIAQEKSRVFPDYNLEMQKFTSAQEEIAKQNTLISERNTMVEKANAYIGARQDERTPWTTEINGLNQLISNLDLEKRSMTLKKENLLKEILHLSKIKHGVKCNTCLGTVDEANSKTVKEQYEMQVKEIEMTLALHDKKYGEPRSAIAEVNKNIIESKEKEKVAIDKLALRRKEIQDAQRMIASLSLVKQPVKDNAQQKSEEIIIAATTTLESLNSRLEGNNPYQQQITDKEELIKSVNDEIAAAENEISSIRDDVPYYDYWVDAFGEDGIRKFAIDQIIDMLNTSIESWMDLLIGDSLVLKFDNMLETTITKYPFSGRAFVYDTLSNGQRRRLNLAVTLSIASVMSMVNNVNPNIIFLDEVSTNIDQQGVVGIYKVIKELSEKKKVFVTTHDVELNGMLESAQKLNLVMENGLTKMVGKF